MIRKSGVQFIPSGGVPERGAAQVLPRRGHVRPPGSQRLPSLSNEKTALRPWGGGTCGTTSTWTRSRSPRSAAAAPPSWRSAWAWTSSRRSRAPRTALGAAFAVRLQKGGPPAHFVVLHSEIRAECPSTGGEGDTMLIAPLCGHPSTGRGRSCSGCGCASASSRWAST